MNIPKPLTVLLFFFYFTTIWSQSGEVDSLNALIGQLMQQQNQATGKKLDTLALALGGAYYELGDAQYNANQYKEAKTSFQTALELQREVLGNEAKGLAPVYEALSKVEERLGKYSQAILYEQVALQNNLDHRGEQSAEVMNNYYNLSNLYEEEWQLDSAEITVEKGMQVALVLFGDEHPNLARGYQLKGDIYNAKKSYAQAETYFKTALGIYEKAGDNAKLRSGYNNLAISFMNQDRYEEAIEYYWKSVRVAEQLEKDVVINTSIGYYNIGLCYKWMGDYEVSIDYVNQAKDIWEKNLGEEHPYVGRAYSVMSDAYTMLEKNDTALSYSLTSLEILRNNYGEKHPLTAQQYYITGLIHNNREEYEKGLEYNQKAIIRVCHQFSNEDAFSNPSIDDISSRETFLEIITAKIFGFFHYWEEDGDIEKLKAALEAAELGIGTMEAMREEFGTWDDSKSWLNSLYLHIYKSAMRISYELVSLTNSSEYQEKAFEIAEKNKAVLLLEAMQSAEAKAVVNIPAAITEKEAALLEKRTELEHQIRELQEAGDQLEVLVAAQTQLLETQQDYADLVDQIGRDYPQFHLLKYDHSVASIKDIQALLDEETLFIEYILKTNESSGEIDKAAIYIFAVSAEDAILKEAPFSEDLKEKITRYYRLFSTPSIVRADRRRQFISLSHELYQLLIQPIESQLAGKNKLIVIGESVLNYIPFGTLLSVDLDQSYEQLPFLIKDYDISYHYSGTLMERMVGKNRPVFEGDLLAFAPVFEDQSVASLDTRHGVEAQDTSFRAFTENGTFEPLPFTAKEVEAIHQLFKTNQLTRNVLMLHDKANEMDLKQLLASSFRFVHLASHSFANIKKPRFSGIACAQNDDTIEDGILYTNEIYQLNLNTELVVLSSCESGFGKLIEGEGILGLNRSFVYAGVPNVVFSLYKIQDNITNQFMTQFYSNILTQQKRFATALREAKLSLLEDKVTASPYFWAGFLLIGQ